MVARRTDQATPQLALDAELATETIDLPLSRLRAGTELVPAGVSDVVARHPSQDQPSAPRTSLFTSRVSASQRAQVALSRRVAGLSGLAVIVLVVAGLASDGSGGDWTATAGWPALPLLLVAMGYQLTTRARLLDRASQSSTPPILRQLIGLIGPIALPAVAVTMVALATAASAGSLGLIDIEAAVGATTMTANLFALYGSSEPSAFEAGLGSAIAPAVDHFWLVALIAQFGLVLALWIGPFNRAADQSSSTGAANSTRGSNTPRGADRRPEMVSALALIAGSIAVARLGLLAIGELEPASVIVHPLTGIDALLLGACLALVPPALVGKINRGAATAGALGVVGLCAIAIFLAVEGGGDPIWIWGLLAPLVALGAVGAVSADVPVVGQFLSSFTLRWLGQRALGILIAYQLLGFALDSTATPAAAAPETVGSTPLEAVAPGAFLALPGSWDLVASVLVQMVFALALGAASHRYLQLPLLHAASANR